MKGTNFLLEFDVIVVWVQIVIWLFSLVKFWQGLDLVITETDENSDKYVVFENPDYFISLHAVSPHDNEIIYN